MCRSCCSWLICRWCAKMNQQRARRFKSAKAAKDAVNSELHFIPCIYVVIRLCWCCNWWEMHACSASIYRRLNRISWERNSEPKGRRCYRKRTEVSDPNVITPGTELMERLSEALEYYIRARLDSDPGWKNIKVCTLSSPSLAEMQ